MNDNNGSEYFGIGVDTAQLERDMKRAEGTFRNLERTAQAEGDKIDGVFRSMTRGAAAFGAALSVQAYSSKIIEIRGQFQQLEVAFKTMLGSEKPAVQLMSQLVETAAVTPFSLQGVADGARQLIAYGVATEEVNDTLVKLGDIAAGLGISLGELTYLYGTTKVQGRMYMQDLNQFTNRGIPLIQELSKQFGVAESEVRGLVTEGKVGFPQVEKAINSLTSAGGKFGGLMKEQSKTITGQISNIGDAIDSMFNKIGKSNEGIINAGLNSVSMLVENYEQAGRVIAGVILTYGAYKAAVMTVVAVNRLSATVLKQATLEKTLAASASMALSDAEALAAAKSKLLAISVNRVKLSLSALTKTMLANPYVLAATAAAGLVAVFMSMKTEEEKIIEAEERYNAVKEKSMELDKKRQDEADKNMRIAEDESNATDTRKEALRNLLAIYPEILSKYSSEYERLKHIRDIKLEIAKLENDKKETASKRELDDASRRLAELQSRVRNSSIGTAILSSDELAEMKMLLAKVPKLRKDINRKESEKAFESRFGIAAYKKRLEDGEDKDALIKEIDSHINRYTNLQSKMKMRGSDTASFGNDVHYSAKELEAFKVRLNDVKTALNAPSYNAQGWIAKYRKDLAKAEKELKEFKSKQGTMSEEDFNKGMTEKLDVVKHAKKKLQSIDSYVTKAESSKKARNKAQLDRELEALHKENTENEISLMQEGHAKRIREIDYEYEQQKERIKQHSDEFSKINKDNGIGSGLTPEQQSAIDEAYRLAEDKHKKQTAQVLKDESDAMREYLEIYGSAMQQKQAIAERYAESIARATTEGERKSLAAERNRELQTVNNQNLLNRVDWAVAFDKVGLTFENILRPIYNDIKALVSTDEFKKQSPSDQHEIIDAMNNLRAIVGEKGSWKELAARLGEYQTALGEYQRALLYENGLKDSLDAERNNLKRAQDNGDKDAVSAAKWAIKDYSSKLQAASINVTELGSKVNTSGNLLKSSANAVINPVSKITSILQSTGIPKLGELFAAFDRLKGGIDALKAIKKAGEVGKEIEDVGKDISESTEKAAKAIVKDAPEQLKDALSDAGAIAQIISAVLTILDILKDGVGPLVAGIIDTILGAIDGLLENILNGKFVEQIGNSLFKGVGGIFKTIAEKLTSLFTLGTVNINWTGGNAEKVNRTIERLTDRNEKLQSSIEDLTEEMQRSRGTKSVLAYRDAKKNQEEANKNYLEIAKAQASYANHHHSWNHYWGGFSKEDMAWIKKYVNADFNGDLFSLTPEEMKKLRANVAIWDKIQSTGKGGYGERLTDKLDDYIDQAGKLKEMTDELYTSLTGMSFDGMYDSFIDKLMDMKLSYKEAVDEMSEYLFKNNLANRIGELFEDDLRGWWEAFGKAMEDGEVSEKEREALLEEYGDIVESALSVRDSLAAATGFDNKKTSQDSTKKGYATASQESVDELNGRFTAVQIDTSAIRQAVEETRGIALIGINHLEAISKNTHELYEINSRLGKIEKNTQRL